MASLPFFKPEQNIDLNCSDDEQKIESQIAIGDHDSELKETKLNSLNNSELDLDEGYIYLYADASHIVQRKFKLGKSLNYIGNRTVSIVPEGTIVFLFEKVDNYEECEKELKQQFYKQRIQNYNGNICEYIHWPTFIYGDLMAELYQFFHNWRNYQGMIRVPSIYENIIALNSLPKIDSIMQHIPVEDSFHRVLLCCKTLIENSPFDFVAPKPLLSRKRKLELKDLESSSDKKLKREPIESKVVLSPETVFVFEECEQLCSRFTDSNMVPLTIQVCMILEKLFLHMKIILSSQYIYQFDTMQGVWMKKPNDAETLEHLLHNVFLTYFDNITQWRRMRNNMSNQRFGKLFAFLGDQSKSRSLQKAIRLHFHNLNNEEKFDKPNSNYFQFSNGVYDLKKGEFRPRRADDYITTCAPHAYVNNPSSESVEDFRRFLTEIFEAESEIVIRLLQAAMCYQNTNGLNYMMCLITSDQKMLYPSTSVKGKTLFISLIQTLFGQNNVGNLDSNECQADDHSMNEKMFCLVDEPERFNIMDMNDSKVKGLPLLLKTPAFRWNVNVNSTYSIIAIPDRHLFTTSDNIGLALPKVPKNIAPLHYGFILSWLANRCTEVCTRVEHKECSWQRYINESRTPKINALISAITDSRPFIERFADLYEPAQRFREYTKPKDIFAYYKQYYEQTFDEPFNLDRPGVKRNIFDNLTRIWDVNAKKITDLPKARGHRFQMRLKNNMNT